MAILQVRGYEVLLLPLFTQAANLYLLFLRDAIAFFKKYLSTLSNMQKISDLNTNHLKDLISEYTDSRVKIYHEGLQT
ncbi:insecticidal delta-endotoxin Cry8Ea1 family protein, partial [Bacillus sp. D-CC]